LQRVPRRSGWCRRCLRTAVPGSIPEADSLRYSSSATYFVRQKEQNSTYSARCSTRVVERGRAVSTCRTPLQPYRAHRSSRPLGRRPTGVLDYRCVPHRPVLGCLWHVWRVCSSRPCGASDAYSTQQYMYSLGSCNLRIYHTIWSVRRGRGERDGGAARHMHLHGSTGARARRPS
jgi:hypothetical protein